MALPDALRRDPSHGSDLGRDVTGGRAARAHRGSPAACPSGTP